MRIDKNHVCYKKSVFGDYLDHDFIYKNKENRRCRRCKIKEIYFGMNRDFEDWRLSE